LKLLFGDLKGLCLLLSKLLPKINLHIIRSGRSEVVIYQLSKVLDLNLQGWFWSRRLEVYARDLKRDLQVHVGANPHQGSLRVLELGLIIIVKFTTN